MSSFGTCEVSFVSLDDGEEVYCQAIEALRQRSDGLLLRVIPLWKFVVLELLKYCEVCFQIFNDIIKLIHCPALGL